MKNILGWRVLLVTPKKEFLIFQFILTKKKTLFDKCHLTFSL